LRQLLVRALAQLFDLAIHFFHALLLARIRRFAAHVIATFTPVDELLYVSWKRAFGKSWQCRRQ
jgi:hypothetical protein